MSTTTIDAPQMTVLQTGKSFKVLQVTGTEGMYMPEHCSTMEAAIVVQKGSAVLGINGKEYALKNDMSFIIPAGEYHTLHLQEDFQAIVIMERSSEIEFDNK